MHSVMEQKKTKTKNLITGISKYFQLTVMPKKANVTCHFGFRICFISFSERQLVILLVWL